MLMILFSVFVFDPPDVQYAISPERGSPHSGCSNINCHKLPYFCALQPVSSKRFGRGFSSEAAEQQRRVPESYPGKGSVQPKK